MSRTGWNMPDGCSVGDVDRAMGGEVPDLPAKATCGECGASSDLVWEDRDQSGHDAFWRCTRAVPGSDGGESTCYAEGGGGFTWRCRCEECNPPDPRED